MIFLSRYVIHFLTHSLTHSLIDSVTHSFTQSLSHFSLQLIEQTLIQYNQFNSSAGKRSVSSIIIVN